MDKEKARQKVSWLRQFLNEGMWMTDESRLKRSRRFVLKLLKIMTTTLTGYRKDGCGLQASALTYITMVSLVPMLAIMFSVSKGIGMQQRLFDAVGVERVVVVPANTEMGIAEEVDFRLRPSSPDRPDQGVVSQLPESMQTVVMQILKYVDHTNFAAMGMIGSLLLIASVILSIAKLEKCFNAIWGGAQARGLVRTFTEYLIVLIVAPILFMLVTSVNSLLLSERVIGWLTTYAGPLTGLAVAACKLVMAAMVFLFFVFLFTFLPNTRVKASAGFWGGLIASILWFTVLWCYLSMQIGLAKFNTIYGTFAALPFFLAVLYAHWCIVLFGCELCYAIQYHRFMRIEKRAEPMPAGCCILLGHLVMVEACKGFMGSERSWDPEKFGVRNAIPMRQLRYVMGVLLKNGLLVQIESKGDVDLFVPGCPPDKITPATVEEAFRKNDSIDGQQYFKLLPEELSGKLHDSYMDFSEKMCLMNYETLAENSK